MTVSPESPSGPSPRSVAVVIPALNAADTLGVQLEALQRQTYSGAWELLVVDNGSTDGTRELVGWWKARLPSIRLVDASSTRGSSHARNSGVAVTDADLIAFCDADDRAGEGWLQALVQAAVNFDLVTGRQEVGEINSSTVNNWRPPRARGLPGKGSRFLPYAPSCNLAVWRDVYLRLGGFSPRYRQAHDVDFSWRAQLAGYSLGFAPGAVMHYRYRASLRSLAHQSYASGYDAALLTNDFSALGLPRQRASSVFRKWAWVAGMALPALIRESTRGTWVRRLGESAGGLVGSIENRLDLRRGS